MSWVSAPVVVKVQAIWPLCPSTRNGAPGAVAPTITRPGVSILARYQMLGKSKLRWGSPASIGAPVTVHRPSSAQASDAVDGRVNGAGKVGRTASTAAAIAAERCGVPG